MRNRNRGQISRRRFIGYSSVPLHESDELWIACFIFKEGAMTRLALLVVVLFLALVAPEALAQDTGAPVTQGGGPPGGIVVAIAIDPASPATLYAGTIGGGVFKSTDGGQSWTAVNFDLTPTSVFALVLDPASPATIYAGTFGKGVFKSSTGGQSWAAINSGLAAAVVPALALDVSSPGTLYAGTGNGVFKSTNSGQSWIAANSGIRNALVTALAVDPTNPATVYAGTGIPGGSGSTGVFKTTDGGQSWIPATSGLPLMPLLSVVTSLAVDPSNPDTVYAGTLGGVFKSTNGGESWTAINSGLEVAEVALTPDLTLIAVLALAIDPSNPATLFAVIAGEGIFRSTDGGQSWTAGDSSLPEANVWALAVDPSNPATLYAVTAGNGVFKSADEGASWTALSSGLAGASISGVAIDPANPAIVYAASLDGGLRKSLDGGQSWDPADSGLPTFTFTNAPEIRALAVDPSNAATAYVASYGSTVSNGVFERTGGVFKSTNGGQSWTAANSGLEETDIQALAIDPANPATLYAGTGSIFGGGDGVFKSTNGGQSWTAANSGLPSFAGVPALAIDPANTATVYAGTAFGGGVDAVFKSTNGGQSWTAVNSGLPSFVSVPALAIDPANTATVYAGTAFGGGVDSVFKSTNGGQSWTAVNSGLPSFANVLALAIDPANTATLYAGTGSGGDGVFKSTNGGQSWSTVNSGLASPSVRVLTIDPNSPAMLYAGTSDGLFKTTDGGASWTAAHSDIPLVPAPDGSFSKGSSTVYSLGIDPASPDTLYSGTISGGVFKSIDGGRSWATANSGLASMLTFPGLTGVFVVPLAIDPANPATIYVGTFGSGVFKSTDGAATWQPTTVIQAGTPQVSALTVGPRVLGFSATVGDPPARQGLQIGSDGEPVNWTATVSLLNGTGWLTVSPSSGTATLAQPAIVIAEVNYSALGGAGVFQAEITVTDTATGSSIAVQVTAVLSAPVARLSLSQTAFVFQGVTNWPPPPQSLTVFNQGTATLNWSLSELPSWLTASPQSGTAGAGSSSLVTLTADLTGEASRINQVLVTVSAPGASNAPQLFTATLNVVSTSTAASADLSPNGMLFVAEQGVTLQQSGTVPGEQDLTVNNTGGGTLTADFAAATSSGGDWLMVNPSSGTASGGPFPTQVSVNPLGLAPGVYRGTVNGSFSSGGPQEVEVLLIVTPPGTALQTQAGLPDAAQCAPSGLHLLATTVGNGLSLPVSFPRVLTALVVDDCGSAVNNATLVASVEGLNIPLRSLRTGFYSGTWVPQSEAAPVRLTLDALHPDFAQVQRSFTVSTAAAPGDVSLPSLFADGVVEGAGFTKRRPLSPGGIISLFGARFANENSFATQLPLERELAGVSVRIGSQDAPLYFVGPGQINAQVPFEVSPGDSVPVTTSVGGLLTAPQNYLIAPVQPGIFIAGENAAILDASFQLVTAQNPVRAGDTIQIFATGLGAVQEQVETGAPAPSFSTVQLPVTVTIGGIDAGIAYQGLAPGFVGLYQVNAVVPAGVATGAVPVVLTQNGIVANPDKSVTIPAQAP